MYRLIIVDDEEVIRNGLVHVVDWESLGFTVVDTFPNGNAALAYLRKNAVDVVIADIRMPRLSGLDLARVLMTEQPETLVVILSGYDHFRYAQEAIDLNVFSYLLKPVKEPDIYEVFARVREQLDDRDNRDSATRRLEAVREREAEDWLIGQTRGRLPSVVSAVFADQEAGGRYCAMVIEPHTSGGSADGAADLLGLCAGLRRVIAETVTAPVILPLILRRPARLAVILAGSEPDIAREVFDAARKEVTSYPEVRLSAAAGPAVDHLDEVPRSFAEAVTVLAHRMYLGLDRLLAPADIEGPVDDEASGESEVSGEGGARQAARHGGAGTAFTEQQVEHLADALVAGDEGRLGAILDEVFDALRERAVADSYLVEATIHALVMQVRGRLVSVAPHLVELLPGDAHLSRDLHGCITLQQCRDLLTGFLHAALEAARDTEASTATTTIAVATSFIQENYHRDLALENVAERVGVSAGYLSRLFRQVRGETFKSYLTHVRLQEAKRLLTETGRRVYEIADRVGYNDQHYFSEVFRKHTGLSPLEYRNRALAGVP